MTYSKLTNQVKISSQSSPRNGTTVDTFLIHHQAGTNDDGVIAAMVSGSKGVSANYTISNEGRITCVVPEELRAWTSGSSYDGGKGAAWDRRSITVEIENESVGGAWPISTAALTAASRLLQDLRSRYTITNVLGHRDLWQRYSASYPTFCPGPETVAKIVALAGNQTSTAGGGELTPFPDTPKRRKKSMSTGWYTDRNGKREWALAGESPGTPANWIPLSTQVTANEVAAIHGSFVPLGVASFDAMKASYLSPVSVSGGAAAVSVDLAPVLTELGKIPSATRDEFAKKPLS